MKLPANIFLSCLHIDFLMCVRERAGVACQYFFHEMRDGKKGSFILDEELISGEFPQLSRPHYEAHLDGLTRRVLAGL